MNNIIFISISKTIPLKGMLIIITIFKTLIFFDGIHIPGKLLY